MIAFDAVREPATDPAFAPPEQTADPATGQPAERGC
jgi:hypothetical protein